MKKLLAMALCVTTVLSFTLTGCGNATKDAANTATEETSESTEAADATEVTEDVAEETDAPELDMSNTEKIGILISDGTTAEALAFRAYYTEYIKLSN